MKKRGLLFLLLASLSLSVPASGGHEAPLYPSYYPQEIKIEAVDPGEAAARLAQAKIHAYVGREPAFPEAPPGVVRRVESLGAFLVVRINPVSPVARDDATSCAAVGAIMQGLPDNGGGFILHPYPVTPFHADHLHHVDRAEAARERFLKTDKGPAAALKVRPKGAGAERLIRGRWPAPAGVDDVFVEEIDTARLTASQDFSLNGWTGPPWRKDGWFHAYLLLAPALDAAGRAEADRLLRRLQAGEAADNTERINLERDLVARLTNGCRSVVAGYALKREYYSAEYSEGVENVAHDSLTGLDAPIFLRTVKLKDFPWNGWLRLGVPSPPAAAWNPFGGFDDVAGRLIWSAIGDPAFFSEPHGAGWVLNRIGDVSAGAGP